MKKIVSLFTVLAVVMTMLFTVSVSADESAERIDLSGTQTLYESAAGEWSSGKIVAKDENGNEITEGLSYSSNYDFVLTVSADGTVTPRHEGCAIVTVTKENPDKTTVSAKIALNVTKGAKLNNRFESGNDLKLNFSRSGNHSVNPSVNSANKSINIQTQSWTKNDTYKRFFVETWFYDDGVISENSEVGAAVNFNAWGAWGAKGWGNVTVGVLDKSSGYYGYKNIQGQRTAAQFTPSMREQTAFLDGTAYASQYGGEVKWPFEQPEAYIERSKGWHQIAISANTNTENQNAVKYYLDGIELFTDNFPSHVQTAILYAADGAYYDDVVLSTYTDTDFENTGTVLSKPQIYGSASVEGILRTRAAAEAPYEFFKTAVVSAGTVSTPGAWLNASKVWGTANYVTPSFAWDGDITYEWETSSDGKNWSKAAGGAEYTVGADDEGKLIRAKASIGESVSYSDIKRVDGAALYNIDGESVRFLGRGENTENGRSMNFPLAGFEFEFSGCGAQMRIAGFDGSAPAYVNITVDGNTERKAVEQNGWVTLCEGLDKGRHTVSAVRSDEPGAYIYADALKTDSSAPSPTGGRVRKLEFIGDSYTAGYGLGGSTSDASKSFAAVTAGTLGADVNVIASSGKGIYKNLPGFAAKKTMAENYDYAELWRDGVSEWNFESYVPQVVTVFLGTNDYYADEGAGAEGFSAAYSAFIKKIRAKYPNASIICCAKNEGCYRQQIEAAVSESGDSKVFYLNFGDLGESGLHAHPNEDEQKILAGKLTEKINSIENVWLTEEEVNITLEIGGGGKITDGVKEISGSFKAYVGGKKVLTLVPDDGHIAGSAVLDGKPLEITDNKITLPEDIKEGSVLKITFKRDFSENGVVFYVSEDGNDNNTGTLSQPFRTIGKAKEAVRTVDKTAAKGITVYIRGGKYKVNSTLAFTAEDGGTENCPVTYRNYGDESVQITGGVHFGLDKFSAVEGEMKDILRSPEAKEKVLVADLDDLGIGEMSEYKIKDNQSVLETPIVTWNGKDMTLARFPNSEVNTDWLSARWNKGADDGTDGGNGKVTADQKAFKLKYNSDIPDSWTFGLDHIMAQGFFYHYWYAPIRYVTLKDGLMIARENTNTAASGVAPNTDNPFRFMNVYQEIDMPGEWYIDIENRKMYLWPLDNSADPDIAVTDSSCALVTLTNTGNITFRGITFTETYGMGLHLSSAGNITFDGCTVSATGRYGMRMDDVTNCTFKNGEFKYCGIGGIYLVTGGNYKTLESGNNLITNSVFDNCSFTKETYAPGVALNGVGNVVSHCEFKNFSHSAMTFGGCLNVMEYNSFTNSCINGTDSGVIYTGRNLSEHGNIIRYNHFYGIGNDQEGRNYFPCCVFTDDGSSDLSIYGNVFGPDLRNVEVFKSHGGQCDDMYDNIIIDATRVYYMCDWSDENWKFVVTENYGSSDWQSKDVYFGTFKQIYDNPLYWERWPWIKDAYEHPEAVEYQSNTISGNMIIYIDKEPQYANGSCWNIRGMDGHYPKKLDTNTIIRRGNTGMFKDYANGNYNLSDDMYAKYKDFPYIDFDAIGRYGVENSAPTAENVKITGAAAVGNTIKGGYTYSDSESDSEGATVTEFLAADRIDGTYEKIADGKTLTITENLRGKYIKFSVTPVDFGGARGETAISAPVYVEETEGDVGKLKAELMSVADSAPSGTHLGAWADSDIEEFKNAIENSDTSSALMTAYENFTKKRITSVSASGTLKVEAGLSFAEINVGELSKVGLTLSGTDIPQLKISGTVDGNAFSMYVPAQTISGDLLVISRADNDETVYGDVLLSLNIGVKSELEIPSFIGKTLVCGEYEKTIGSGRMAAENPGCYSVAALYKKSGDTSLSELFINDRAINIIKGKTEYRATVKEGTAAIVSAKAANAYAKVEVTQAESLPGTATVKVIAQNGTEAVYTVAISEIKSPSDDNGDEPSETPGGGNGGGVTKPSGNKGTSGFYSGETTNPSISNPFTDMAGHWAAADVLAMNKAGIVSGVSDTLFDPDRNITRAEFAAIIARALKLNDKTADYKDVNNEWFAPYVGACSEAGIISGYDGYFRPNDNITRQEMAVIIVNAYSYLEKQGANGGIDNFTDKAEIADWAKAAVDTASSVGLISGMGDGTFAPSSNATRAQAASIVRRLLG